jgi:hypothetical protein
MKLAQRDEMKEKQRMKIAGEDEDGGANDEGDGEGDAEVDGDLFSTDGQVAGMPMDID